jgi:hypothetical protein
MTEKTAAEILAAQYQYDLETAKAQVETALHQAAIEDEPLIDALEAMIFAAVKVYHTRRLARANAEVLDLTPELRERIGRRINALAECTQMLINKSGPPTVESLQMSIFNVTSELSALWALMMQSGLTTAVGRQDLIENGVYDLHNRIREEVQKIQIAIPSGRGN